MFLKNLCSDLILGHDFQKQHKNLVIHFGGTKRDLIISNHPYCALSTADIELPSLFSNLSTDIKPIATKSRHFNKDDKKFIENEISKLLEKWYY